MGKRKKKQKDRVTLTIDITDLSSKCKTPKNMEIWTKDNPMSKKVEKLIDECTNLVAYMAKRLNEGPEVKTNIMKRASITKALIQFLIKQVYLDNFHRLGMLDQIMYDLKASRSQTIVLAVEEQSISEKKEKGNNHRSRYVA